MALFLAPALFPTTPISQAEAQQQNILRIAAVVNDDIISILDLENRMRLIALSSKLDLNAEARERLLPQVLRTMIDEKLQFQAAMDANIRVSERELDQQLAQIAQQSNLPSSGMAQFLASRGIDIATLKNQIEASLIWRKYAQRRLARGVRIGPDQIEEELDRLNKAAQQPQKHVYEIYLSVDNSDRAGEVEASAQRLLDQIRNGADFSSLAQTFSEGSTARTGGDIGWVSSGQLPEELDNTIQSLAPGDISAPIRTLTGFHLLYVTGERVADADPRDSIVDLVQMTAPVARNGGDQDALLQALSRETADLNGCEALTEFANSRDGINAADAEGIRIGSLSKEVQEVILPLSAGDVSRPFANRNAVVILGVCTREDAELTLPSRDEVQARLGNQRLNLVIRRKMRDLRRAAFIDIRL